jgi:hypothetical protein
MPDNKNLTVEIFKFDMQGTPESRLDNLELLRFGVIGVHCTARNVLPSEYGQFAQYIPLDCTFGTVEEYANGALNLYIRRNSSLKTPAHMFLRVRQ